VQVAGRHAVSHLCRVRPGLDRGPPRPGACLPAGQRAPGSWGWHAACAFV